MPRGLFKGLKFDKVDHIGIAVRSLEDSLDLYTRILGLELVGVEEVAQEGVRIAMLRLGEVHIELLEPIDPGGTVARFVEKRGPGIHHIAFSCGDVEAAGEELKNHGLQLVYPRAEEIRGLRVVNFIHPRSSSGVLLELVRRLS
jgi:methylmalonyl-CoA epimerase